MFRDTLSRIWLSQKMQALGSEDHRSDAPGQTGSIEERPLHLTLRPSCHSRPSGVSRYNLQEPFYLRDMFLRCSLKINVSTPIILSHFKYNHQALSL